MARAGPIGGAATLSSSRVQKAFSINFRENKRLLTEVKLIENEHIRNIRLVKQDIKETRIWLDSIRESTGQSKQGLRPDSESRATRKNVRRKKKTPPRSKTVEPLPQIVIDGESSVDEEDHNSEAFDDERAGHVRFVGEQELKPKTPRERSNLNESFEVRPWTDAQSAKSKNIQRSEMKSEPAPNSINARNYEHREENLANEKTEVDDDSRKSRADSIASGRSSLGSLSAFQRRRKLQSMMIKQRNALDRKREMNSKDCKRVDNKVKDYLDNFTERMSISLPDMSLWEINYEQHDTPFAQEANITN